jgi:hypothetical protein
MPVLGAKEKLSRPSIDNKAFNDCRGVNLRGGGMRETQHKQGSLTGFMEIV